LGQELSIRILTEGDVIMVLEIRDALVWVFCLQDINHWYACLGTEVIGHKDPAFLPIGQEVDSGM
jgi:hypothetical protein